MRRCTNDQYQVSMRDVSLRCCSTHDVHRYHIINASVRNINPFHTRVSIYDLRCSGRMNGNQDLSDNNYIPDEDFRLIESLYIQEQKQKREEAEYLLNYLWRKTYEKIL